jgi:hypothetical protein
VKFNTVFFGDCSVKYNITDEGASLGGSIFVTISRYQVFCYCIEEYAIGNIELASMFGYKPLPIYANLLRNSYIYRNIYKNNDFQSRNNYATEIGCRSILNVTSRDFSLTCSAEQQLEDLLLTIYLISGLLVVSKLLCIDVRLVRRSLVEEEV